MSDTIPMKTCTGCNKTLPATREFFRVSKHGVYGLESRCKECRKLYFQAHYQANKERLLAEQRVYRENNPEKRRETTQKYYQNHKEEVSKRNLEWRAKNPDKSHQIYRRYAENNRKKLAERSRRWHHKNSDKKKLYRKKKREQYLIYGHNRRARIRSLPDTFTHSEWLICLEYFNYCCAVCGAQLRDLFGDVLPHQDHWIAVSNPECPGTVAENMVCLCNDCNFSKQAQLPDVWLKQKFGTRKANIILARIEAYFAWVLSQTNQENKSA